MNGIYLILLQYALKQLLGTTKGTYAYNLFTTTILPIVGALGANGELPAAIAADVTNFEAAVAASQTNPPAETEAPNSAAAES